MSKLKPPSRARRNTARNRSGVIRKIGIGAYLDTILESTVDGACQEIAGIAFQLKALQQKGQASGAIEPAALTPIVELLQNAIRRTRTLSHRLYPVKSGPDGLGVALEQLAASTAELPGISCTFRCPERIDVPGEETATQLYRIAQEAVRDVLERRKAKTIEMELRAHNGSIIMSISDIGAGSESESRVHSDIPLQLLRHRAAIIGARLQITSIKNGGRRFACVLPQQDVKYR